MIIKELKELNAKNVLSYITQEEIFKFYLPKAFKFNIPFSSPFRVDKNPSFVISSKSYRYKDFASGQSGNCFNFVMELYKINFNEALIQIISDFHLRSEFFINDSKGYILNTKKAEFKNAKSTLYTGSSLLQIKQREFTKEDYEYWESFGISPTWLRLGRIFPISHYFINGTMFIAEKYAYAYIEKKDNIITYKVYQPFSKYRKWISSNNYSVVELWHLLPKNANNLILTSSRKDALAVMNISRIPSISFQSETTLPKKHVMLDLLSRFDNVYILYDNDYYSDINNGQILAKKLIKLYPKLKNISIDESYKSKDFSDLIKNVGITNSKKILLSLLFK